jgi:hypothetical protein
MASVLAASRDLRSIGPPAGVAVVDTTSAHIDPPFPRQADIEHLQVIAAACASRLTLETYITAHIFSILSKRGEIPKEFLHPCAFGRKRYEMAATC